MMALMMKKTDFLFAMVLLFSGILLSLGSPNARAQPSATKPSQILIDSLDADQIFNSFYLDQQQTAAISNDDHLRDGYFAQFTAQILNRDTMLFFHPYIEYQNTQGDNRYLVMVEKVKYAQYGIVDCHACYSRLDLLIYKAHKGKFQLLNYAENQQQIPSSWGHLELDFRKKILQNWQAMGAKIIGSYLSSTTSGAGGQESYTWYALLLPDSGRVEMIEIGSGGGSTEDYYSEFEGGGTTSSTLSVIDNQSEYFPIEISYIDHDRNAVGKRYKSVFIYQKSTQKYIEQPTKEGAQ